MTAKRRICFVTGTRAEYGLMRSTLRRIAEHRGLSLQIVATGMHLDRSRGRSLKDIQNDGWHVDAIVPWNAGDGSQSATAAATGKAISALVGVFDRLQSDAVLVVGDRVEAFAAASAGHLSGRIVAHVHGGDRALGLVDDSLRHAITKLAHVHFPATAQSAQRIRQLGEDSWRIIRAGSPGLDEINSAAASGAELRDEFPGISPRRFALLVLHPETPDEEAECAKAATLLNATMQAGFDQTIIIYPNNDPGSASIARYWVSMSNVESALADAGRTHGETLVSLHPPRVVAKGEGGMGKYSCPCSSGSARARVLAHATHDYQSSNDKASSCGPIMLRRNLPRQLFLGLLRDAAVLVGNSSSGIIESASFGTPVIDIGDRQTGRERGPNVMHIQWSKNRLRTALQKAWNDGHPIRFPARNPYGTGGAGKKIANELAKLDLSRFQRKLIVY